MSKKIVVISSSFRKEGNTQALVNEFIRGAEDAGNDVLLLAVEQTIRACWPRHRGKDGGIQLYDAQTLKPMKVIAKQGENK